MKPRCNVGIDKRKVFGGAGKKDLFIVGPWVKKAGGKTIESMRVENADNMNAHLSWSQDEVLTFDLTLYNPLKVPLQLSQI